MAIATGEWVILLIIVMGVVVTISVVFWEGLRRLMGVKAPTKTGDPLPNADYTKYVWNAADVSGTSPAKKTVVMTYDEPQRVSMSFFLDLTGHKDAYLDPIKPIKINGDNVPLKDLPADPEKLSAVKK